MKTALVTGATGALGQAVVARLRQGGYRVVATSRRHHDDGAINLDVREPAQIAAAIDHVKPDLLLHLAATLTGDFCEAYAVNVEASRHILDAVQESGARTRVVLIGSAAEYGVVRPEENPINEEHALNPVSVYGLTKAWQTQLAGMYANRGMDVVVARIFNLDGPGLSERLFIGRLESQIAEVMAGRRSVIELGSLSAVRDYLSTREAAEQIIAISEFAATGRVCHVASGVPVTMRELMRRHLADCNLDESIVREAADLSNRVGYDVPAIYADVTNTMQLMKLWRTGGEA